MPDSLTQLTKDILSCRRCELRQNATRPVPSLLILGGKYFLIGEAPGREEDEQGMNFIGVSGRRLDKLIVLADIDINECSFANVCKCRPPANRDPRKKEIRACVEFLWREIRLVKPQYLITLGSLPLSLFCPYGIRQCHGTQMEVEIPDERVVFEETQPTKVKKARVVKIEAMKEEYASSLERLFNSSL